MCEVQGEPNARHTFAYLHVPPQGALRLELTRELSATAFLLAFRHFTSRRGLPKVIMSDNAKTFKHYSQEISHPSGYMTNHQIEWKFIVKKAPWWGDIGSV